MFFKVNVLSGRHRARQPKNRVLTPAVGLKIMSRMLLVTRETPLPLLFL